MSSMVMMCSVRIYLGWSLRQLDLNTVFLHGTLQEVVYMVLPPGYIHPLSYIHPQIPEPYL